ncbi:MAG: glucose-6-phosphate dehydrogenase assembly protein OpcA, partial [Kitasatospora sp.]|nr:glucose-6-phosphate dehydrogenase assembly protein OpcA [Kitasatospora sp.]
VALKRRDTAELIAEELRRLDPDDIYAAAVRTPVDRLRERLAGGEHAGPGGPVEAAAPAAAEPDAKVVEAAVAAPARVTAKLPEEAAPAAKTATAKKAAPRKRSGQ